MPNKTEEKDFYYILSNEDNQKRWDALLEKIEILGDERFKNLIVNYVEEEKKEKQEVKYVGLLDREYGYRELKENGDETIQRFRHLYSVNPNNHELLKSKEEELVKERSPELILVGIKPENILRTLPIKYKADSSREYGLADVIEEGEDEVTKKTYLLDEMTGEVTPNLEIIQEGKSRTIIKATGSTKLLTNLDFAVLYESDPLMKEGERKVKQSGKAGLRTENINYTLDELTGEIHAKVESVAELAPVDEIVLVGTAKNDTEEVNHKDKEKYLMKILRLLKM